MHWKFACGMRVEIGGILIRGGYVLRERFNFNFCIVYFAQ